MKKLILIFSLLLPSAIYAFEQCHTAQQDAFPKESVDNFGQKMAVIANKSVDDSNVKVQAGATFLASIQGTTNFSEQDAKSFIASVTPICENSSLGAKFRSKACNVASGLNGKLAQKLGMGGVTNGKLAYQLLQTSLKLDPDNVEAINGHAVAIIGLSDQGWLVRSLAEKSLNTNIHDEALKAKSNLERANLTEGLLYKQILKII